MGHGSGRGSEEHDRESGSGTRRPSGRGRRHPSGGGRGEGWVILRLLAPGD